ncbi:MAG: hypothetical protein ACJ8G1_25070 [Vitreoscilla sp.]|jgi:hypothetical protein
MNTKLLTTLALFAALSGCGGDSTPPAPAPVPAPSPAPMATPTTLAYTDPTSSGWRLVKDAASTPTRLVLDLVGPAGTPTRGVGFNLKRGAGLAFGKFDNGGYAHDLGVYQLKGSNSNFESYAGTEADPVLFVSAPLKSGDVLSTGIFQKDRSNGAKDSAAPLVQVVVTLADFTKVDSATVAAAAEPYGLHVTKARIVPSDIGGFNLTTEVLKKARMVDITVDTGTITATP